MKDSTKRTLCNTLVAAGLLVIGFGFGSLIRNSSKPEEPEQETVDMVAAKELTLDDHIKMIVPDKLQNVCKALIMVESEGKADAVSSCGRYVGILQIGKLYLDECNRLQDSITFTMEDRFDSVKSLQMFVIYQTNYNPGHDIDRAIQLHNPTAGPDYKHKVKTKLNTIYYS